MSALLLNESIGQMRYERPAFAVYNVIKKLVMLSVESE